MRKGFVIFFCLLVVHLPLEAQERVGRAAIAVQIAAAEDRADSPIGDPRVPSIILRVKNVSAQPLNLKARKPRWSIGSSVIPIFSSIDFALAAGGNSHISPMTFMEIKGQLTQEAQDYRLDPGEIHKFIYPVELMGSGDDVIGRNNFEMYAVVSGRVKDPVSGKWIHSEPLRLWLGDPAKIRDLTTEEEGRLSRYEIYLRSEIEKQGSSEEDFKTVVPVPVEPSSRSLDSDQSLSRGKYVDSILKSSAIPTDSNVGQASISWIVIGVCASIAVIGLGGFIWRRKRG